MKISRRGSERDHGTSSIEIKLSKIKWESSSRSIEIKDFFVADFTTDSNHDYTINLDIIDITYIIKILASSLEVDENLDGKPSQASAILVFLLPDLIKLASYGAEIQKPVVEALMNQVAYYMEKAGESASGTGGPSHP